MGWRKSRKRLHVSVVATHSSHKKTRVRVSHQLKAAAQRSLHSIPEKLVHLVSVGRRQRQKILPNGLRAPAGSSGPLVTVFYNTNDVTMKTARELLISSRYGFRQNKPGFARARLEAELCARPQANTATDDPLAGHGYDDDTGFDWPSDATAYIWKTVHYSREVRRHIHKNRRVQQTYVWHSGVIPSLVEPYMVLQHATMSGRLPEPPLGLSDCTCGGSSTRPMTVTLIRWDGMSHTP